MKASIVIFDNFTDIDVWLMWDLLKRVRKSDWDVQLIGERDTHISQTGILIPTHGRLSEANQSDVVLFTSGPGTRTKIDDQMFLAQFHLNPERQMIGAMCSGALLLAALGVLKPGQLATTYPTARQLLERYQIQVVERAFVQHGNIATAAGCLAALSLAGWVIERFAGSQTRELVLNSIQPVGEGLSLDSNDLDKLYSTSQLASGDAGSARNDL